MTAKSREKDSLSESERNNKARRATKLQKSLKIQGEFAMNQGDIFFSRFCAVSAICSIRYLAIYSIRELTFLSEENISPAHDATRRKSVVKRKLRFKFSTIFFVLGFPSFSPFVSKERNCCPRIGLKICQITSQA